MWVEHVRATDEEGEGPLPVVWPEGMGHAVHSRIGGGGGAGGTFKIEGAGKYAGDRERTTPARHRDDQHRSELQVLERPKSDAMMAYAYCTIRSSQNVA